jgi:hypothetical protein
MTWGIAKAPARAAAVAAIAALFSTAAIARAQQPVFTMAATEPSAGVWMFREQVQYYNLGRDPTGLDREVNEYRSHIMLSYGVTSDFSVGFMLPVVYRDINSPQPGVAQDIFGTDDLMVMTDLRVWQQHSGPIDTTRLSLTLGGKIPTGSPDITAGRFEPMAGAVLTLIRGRHGADFAVQYEYNTGGFENPVRAGDGMEDAIWYDAAYLYRLAPAVYDPSTRGAWYATVEMNGVYELNGDNEILLAPGLMYEGGNFALELGVQVPAWQEIEHRPKTNFGVVLGFRLLF